MAADRTPPVRGIHARAGDVVSRPRLLDLFCGAGGAGMGYHRAGFEVVGVDINPQPRYPFEFHQADALSILRGMRDYPTFSGEMWRPGYFAAVHASPPCQAYSAASRMRTDYVSRFPRLIEPVRDLLADIGIPWVIENVVGAPLRSPTLLCGETFGLRVRRHRLFESTHLLFGSSCQHHGDIVGVYGDHAEDAYVNRRGGVRRAASTTEAREAMGVPWMVDWHEVKESIPPAYTEFLGEQLLAHLAVPA